MIKRRFYKVEHADGNDDASDSSSDSEVEAEAEADAEEAASEEASENDVRGHNESSSTSSGSYWILGHLMLTTYKYSVVIYLSY